MSCRIWSESGEPRSRHSPQAGAYRRTELGNLQLIACGLGRSSAIDSASSAGKVVWVLFFCIAPACDIAESAPSLCRACQIFPGLDHPHFSKFGPFSTVSLGCCAGLQRVLLAAHASECLGRFPAFRDFAPFYIFPTFTVLNASKSFRSSAGLPDLQVGRRWGAFKSRDAVSLADGATRCCACAGQRYTYDERA